MKTVDIIAEKVYPFARNHKSKSGYAISSGHKHKHRSTASEDEVDSFGNYYNPAAENVAEDEIPF